MQHFGAPQHEPRPLTLFLQLLLEQANGDTGFIRDVLAGVRAYQSAARHPRQQSGQEIFRIGAARVMEFSKTGRPVLFVPSLINPPYVLDLATGNSLMQWLATRDLRPLLIDWGDPREGDLSRSVGAHIEQILLPLIDRIGPDVILAGYCLGGTMALAAAAHARVRGLVMMAAPWNFDGYPSDTRAGLADIWQAGRPAAEALNLFPMEMLQSAFWRLDPQRTLSKFAAFGKTAPGSPEADAFVALEDWANEGPPLTVPAARELFQDLYGANLTGNGGWTMAAGPVDPSRLDCPALNIISTTDRIVPAASAAEIGERLVLDQGHVGMIIGRRAQATLWEPLHRWLSHLR